MPEDNAQLTNEQFNRLATWTARAIRQVSSPHDQYDGDRDFEQVFSYLKDPDFSNFKHWYEHDPVAGRIVDGPPADMWQKPPEIKALDENGDPVNGSEFQRQFEELDKKLGLISEFKNVDQQARIGRWGVLFLGLADVSGSTPDQKLVQEVDPEELNGSISDLLFVSSYDEGNAKVARWDRDPTSERNGLPRLYQIDQDIPSVDEDRIDQESLPDRDGGMGDQDLGALAVNHSRIIHVAEDAKTNPAVGRPVLKRVINRLIDKTKIVGGAAEGFYQIGASRWFHKLPDDFAVPDPDSDEATDLQDEYEKWSMGIKKMLSLPGELENLGGENVTPEEAYEVVLTEVAIASGIPKTRLKGHEIGERASEENKMAYFGKLKSRRKNHAEPKIIRPTIDRFIEFGILPTPENGYTVEWPDLHQLSDLEEAELKAKLAKAIKDMSPQGQTDLLADVPELRQKLGLPKTRPSENDQSTNEQLAEEERLREVFRNHDNGYPVQEE